MQVNFKDWYFKFYFANFFSQQIGVIEYDKVKGL